MMILLNKYPRSVAAYLASPHVGLFVTPPNRAAIPHLDASGKPWAADNGCFTRWDMTAFRAMLKIARNHLGNCLFVTAPDVVGDGYATLGLFHWWLGEIADADEALDVPLALVGQDGMEDLDADTALSLADAFFIGGSTLWKTSAAATDLAVEAKRRGKWVHMGRVNTPARLRAAYDMGCDSVDGSSFNWFPEATIPQALARIVSLFTSPRLPGMNVVDTGDDLTISKHD